MKIYRPIQTNRKTQAFGGNNACAKMSINGKPIRPFKIASTNNGVCPIGYTSFYPLIGMKGHNGEDWATWHGEPLYFPVSYPVQWWAKQAGDLDGGIGVDVVSKTKIPFESGDAYVKFRFWHLKSTSITDGQEIELGDLLGLCDSTGASSGDHLHWSMKKCDAEGNAINRFNGYTGAEDFSKYFVNVFVLDVLTVKYHELTLEQELTKLIFKIRAFLNDLLH